jgi:hypothetical protein
MSTQLFVNVNASSIASALVRAVDNMSPIPFPQLVIGDGRQYELYFVDGTGNFAAFSGNAGYIPYIAIGECGFPTGGTAIWTWSGHSTGALAYNISPAALQTALEALSGIGAGNIAVAGVAGKYYVVTFQGTLGGAAQPEITVNFAALTPASTVEISTVVTGASGINAVQLATLAENPITFADDWTTIANGWTGQLSTRTLEIFQAFVAAGNIINDTFQITVGDPLGVRTTFLKISAQIQCTIINPESFAGADKPLLATQAALNAAVLGQNNFARSAFSSTAAGNTDIPKNSTCRHLTAVITVSNGPGTRTFSLLGTGAVAGDTILAVLLPDTTAGNLLEIFNASPAGTLLASITTDISARPYFVMVNWNGTAWEIDFDSSLLLPKNGNLSGLADTHIAKANLKTIFANSDQKTANFTVTADDEGKLFQVDSSGGAVAATLPSAATVGDGFLVAVQKIEPSTQIVTTIPATISLISGGQTALLRSNGAAWVVVLFYDPESTAPSALSVIQNRFDITALTGSGANVLINISTAGGVTPVGTSILVAAGTGGAWVLMSGTDAESVSKLRPADYDPALNPVFWQLFARCIPPFMTQGDLLYFDGANIVSLPKGTAGQLLAVNTGATAPVWIDSGKSTTNAQTMTSGDSVITPVSSIHSEVVTVAGAARTSNLLVQTGQAGWITKIRFLLPATAGIIINIKDADSGAILYTAKSDDGGGSAHNEYFEILWTLASPTTTWSKLFNVTPIL